MSSFQKDICLGAFYLLYQSGVPGSRVRQRVNQFEKVNQNDFTKLSIGVIRN